MVEEIRKLCSLNGVSSDEDAVRNYLQEQIRPFADEIRTDTMGNLIVWKRGRKSAGHKIMFTAHMDEVGIVVTGITKKGYLRFDFIGAVDRRVALGRKVVIGPNQVPGVIGMKAVHLVDAEERKKIPKTEALYVDIGAADQKEAEELLSLGDCGAFVCEPEMFGSGFLKAKALDDRAGCAVLLQLLREDLPVDLTAVFTVQEEVGARGIFGAAFSVTPEIALALEAVPSAELPDREEHRRICACGKGPVLSCVDGGTIYDRGLFELLRDTAEQNGIPWQTRENVSGGNDARVVQRMKTGVRVAAVSVPVRCLHAPAGIGSIADMDHMLQLVRLFLVRLADLI